MPVIERIAEAGVVLALHVGADAYDQIHPSRVATIARAGKDGGANGSRLPPSFLLGGHH